MFVGFQYGDDFYKEMVNFWKKDQKTKGKGTFPTFRPILALPITKPSHPSTPTTSNPSYPTPSHLMKSLHWAQDQWWMLYGGMGGWGVGKILTIPSSIPFSSKQPKPTHNDSTTPHYQSHSQSPFMTNVFSSILWLEGVGEWEQWWKVTFWYHSQYAYVGFLVQIPHHSPPPPYPFNSDKCIVHHGIVNIDYNCGIGENGQHNSFHWDQNGQHFITRPKWSKILHNRHHHSRNNPPLHNPTTHHTPHPHIPPHTQSQELT